MARAGGKARTRRGTSAADEDDREAQGGADIGGDVELVDGDGADDEDLDPGEDGATDDDSVAALGEDDFDGDDGVDGDDLEAALSIDDKQGSARELAIRRALEERREKQRLKEDLDYLDFDPDD
ncbi:MAG: hypothetical protein AAF918_07695 [Pseudomonadota bacterium]